jgi:hypothetical protein
MRLPPLSDCSDKRAENASGVLATTSKPRAENSSFTLSSFKALMRAPCRRARTGFGVPATASRPSRVFCFEAHP